MKSNIIFVVGFAVLAVAVAREPAGEYQPVEPCAIWGVTFEQIFLAAARLSQQNEPEYRQALNAKPPPRDFTIRVIPLPDSLTLKSNPLAISRNLRTLEKGTRDIYVKELEHLRHENRFLMQWRFYNTALKAIDSPKEASQTWNKYVQEVKNYGKEMTENFPEIDNLFNDNTPLATISDILNNDPLAAAESKQIPIKLVIAANSCGSLEVASSFNSIYSCGEKVKGSIQKLILDRIAEKGGVKRFYQKYFRSPSPKPNEAGHR